MTHEEIHKVCEKYNIENYTINNDCSIDVDGDVNLKLKGLTKLPLNFNIVYGNFFCSLNKLTSLEGSPKKVGGVFDCVRNKLTTLKYAPLEVGDGFFCYANPIRLDYNNYLKSVNRVKKIKLINCYINQQH